MGTMGREGKGAPPATTFRIEGGNKPETDPAPAGTNSRTTARRNCRAARRTRNYQASYLTRVRSHRPVGAWHHTGEDSWFPLQVSGSPPRHTPGGDTMGTTRTKHRSPHPSSRLRPEPFVWTCYACRITISDPVHGPTDCRCPACKQTYADQCDRLAVIRREFRECNGREPTRIEVEQRLRGRAGSERRAR